MDPLIGKSLGPYVLVERLGAGGMGAVYRAVHRMLDQPRALKILPPNLAAEETFVERFQREARTAARLRHPNIVQIHDVGEHQGAYYIAMELVEGRSLRDVLHTDGSLSLVRATRLLRPLAEALDFAHAGGVVHRDVKPANVLVGSDDRVTLVDFGIARAGEAASLTRTGMMVGTPEYLAPEMLRGTGGGPSADLYALAVVAYEMLCGRPPFAGLNTPAMLYAQLHTIPPAPRSLRADLPAAVEAALLRQLAKDPPERYPTGAAFVHALVNAPRTPTRLDPEEAPTPPYGVAVLAEPRPRAGPPAMGIRPHPRIARPEAADRWPRTAAPLGRRGAVSAGSRSGLWGMAALLGVLALTGGVLALGSLWWLGLPADVDPASVSTAAAQPTGTSNRPTVVVEQTIPAAALAAAAAVGAAAAAPPPSETPAPPPATAVARTTAVTPPASAGRATEVARLEMLSHGFWSVTFAPDGQTLALASGDYAVRRSRGTDLAVLGTLRGHFDRVSTVAFAPDGQTLASGAWDRWVQLWRPTDGAWLRTLEGHTGPVRSVVFAPDGQTLASASWDRTVRLWRVADGTPLRTLEGHADGLLGVAFAPDGQTLASASQDSTVRLWRVADGAVLHTLQGHTHGVLGVAFAPDGQTLASASQDMSVRLWRVSDGVGLRTLQGHTGPVSSVAFAPDGQSLASASEDNTVRLWRTADATALRTIEGHTGPVTSVAFAPDGQTLASASFDNTVRLWRAR